MTAFLLIKVLPFVGRAFAQGGAGANGGTGHDGGTGVSGGVSIPLSNPLSPCTDALCLLGKIILFLYNLAIPVTVIMVLVGGFQILTAAGDPEKFSTGRKTILYAAVGFTVVFFANSIVPIIRDIFK